MSSPILQTPPEALARRAAPRRGRPRLAGLLAVALARPQRPVSLGLAAAAVGLIAALAGIFHPAPRELAAPPPGDVALVNQQPILMSDFINETEKATSGDFAAATPAQRASTLHEMIDQELLVQRALALNLPEEDTNVREALADATNNEIASGVLARPVSEEALRAYFAAHASRYATMGQMNLTDLVLHVGGFENVDQSVSQAMADAAEAVYELRSGAKLDYVEQHFGMADSGKLTGDNFDFAAQLRLGPKLFAVAKGLDDGEVSDPIADADGVHVLIMHHRAAPQVGAFDSVRNNVYHDYIKDEEAREQQSNLKYLRSTSQIIIAPGQSE